MLECGTYPSFGEIGVLLSKGFDFEGIQDDMNLPDLNTKAEYFESDLMAVTNDRFIRHVETKESNKTSINEIIYPSDVSPNILCLSSGIQENTANQRTSGFYNYLDVPAPLLVEPEAPDHSPLSQYMNKSIATHQTAYQPHNLSFNNNPFMFSNNMSETQMPRLPPGFEQTIVHKNNTNSSNINRSLNNYYF